MLAKLITEGQELKNHLISSQGVPTYVETESYEKWKTKCILYLKDNNDVIITDNYINASKLNSESSLKKSLGILIGLKEYNESK